MLEATEVVAIAAGVASVGAAMPVNVAEVKVAAGAASSSSPPPQALSTDATVP